LRKVQINHGIEIASFADVAAGTGLGSSSAFTVGLLNALYAFNGQLIPKNRLAAEACEIEIDILKEPIGKQDQYAAAYGNINHIRFNQDETVDVKPIMLNISTRTKLENRLKLYYFGGKRDARDILRIQSASISKKNTFRMLKDLVELTSELETQLNQQSISSLGMILHKGWLTKRQLAGGISNGRIDRLYNTTLLSG
tara:strand:- start:27 stop:620 length:594 start_codon:yes stop_codon:yes gene_type:complete